MYKSKRYIIFAKSYTNKRSALYCTVLFFSLYEKTTQYSYFVVKACFNTLTAKKPAQQHDKQDRCTLPLNEGTCDQTLTRFYYDVDEERCKLFIFKGCGGNDNKFSSPWQCRDKCGGDEPYWGPLEPTGLLVKKKNLRKFS